MNWDAIGALAELIGSIAVVVTLVFLILQMRHNATMTKNATLQNSLNANTDILSNLISDPGLFDIYHRGIRSDHDLNSQERGRFEILLLLFFRMGEAQFIQFREGTADFGNWEGLVRTFKSSLLMPGFHASWERQKPMVSQDFAREVDSWGVIPHKAAGAGGIVPTA